MLLGNETVIRYTATQRAHDSEGPYPDSVTPSRPEPPSLVPVTTVVAIALLPMTADRHETTTEIHEADHLIMPPVVEATLLTTLLFLGIVRWTTETIVI